MNAENYLSENNIIINTLPTHLMKAVNNIYDIEKQYFNMPNSEAKNMIAELLIKSDDALLIAIQKWYSQNKDNSSQTAAYKIKMAKAKMKMAKSKLALAKSKLILKSNN
jgi:hypothetical protein